MTVVQGNEYKFVTFKIQNFNSKLCRDIKIYYKTTSDMDGNGIF